MKTFLREKQGSAGSQREYVSLTTNEGVRTVVVNKQNQGSDWKHQGIKHTVQSVFLPEGYPDSVSDDYLQYQLWDTIQAFSSSLTGSLATKAVLEGVGVGDSTSTPLAATLSWLIKDGAGMVGRILFAWSKGTELDADSKKWRLFADILNDSATCIELSAPYLATLLQGSRSTITAVLCLAGVAKSIVGVAGGATRAALTQHQARRGNLADVSAKDGSQETLVNLAALITSLWLLPFVGDSQMWTWLAFFLFTCLHLFANFKAVKAVRMETFNQTRFLLVLHQYASTKKIMSVQEANRFEPVVMGFIPSAQKLCGYRIHLGNSMENMCHTELETQLRNFQTKRYAIIPDEPHGSLHILIQEDCSSEEMLEAYFIAALSAMIASHRVTWFDSKWKSLNLDRIPAEVLKENLWTEFNTQLIEKGWNTKRALLAPGEWRAMW